jgi:cystathionine beta-lyase/cystathionine gamma-synthase
MGFSTIAIHAGNEPDSATGAVSVPIYQTSTYAQEGLGKHKGFEYARTHNPTRLALEKNIAALEGAKFGFAFASGMSATDAVLKLVKAGDHVILGDNTYGGTYRLFSRVLVDYGVEFDLVDTTDAVNIERAFKPNTKMVFVETPTNPVMSVTDLRAVSEIAHAHGSRVVCDNTFMSPYLQRPMDFGVDIVVHSTTKYLNGHSDSIGGTYRLFSRVLVDYGVEFDLVDTTDAVNIERAFKPNTKMVFVETPTNPVMSVTDLRAVSEIAHAHGSRVVCDNTFMSPYLQRPMDFGVDIVVHSTTKYLNGHSDSIGGFVALNDETDAEWIGFIQNSIGAILSPFDSFLVLRGTKTLAVRMEAHDRNGRAVAAFLAEHPRVQRVYYPGLQSHPQFEIASRQQRGFGGMVAFETGSLENAKKVLESVKLCTLAESLGGVESLISHPATMTHASIPLEKRQTLGISDGLIRISVGIEDIEDIIADLDQALL